ncbi:MAG: acyltransferase family protein [Candidatus Planktophila sp.]
MATKRGIQHIPAIDGLRAIAVTAVIFYHLGFSWIPGGFLGVDLFFVISGYVITRLLLDSIARSGGLDLRGFYKARARRLLPPMIFMIVVTAFYITIWAQDSVRRFLSDVIFSLTGTMNWWLVFKEQDYFEAIGRPPLLQHTWSLAVEAQFYLIWPVLLLLILKRFGKKVIPVAALAIALISGAVLFYVSLQLDASSEVSHIYFGTDTHSIGLFLGSALAVSWIPQNFKSEVSERAQNFIDFIGVFGLVGILAAFLLIDESSPTAYKIAFPLAAIFGVAIITSIVHPASRFAPILNNRILLWIGERSYAIYLWHWVIFQITRPQVDIDGDDWALIALRILVVLALADISLKLVELPIRSGAVEYWFKGMKYRTATVRKRQKISVISSIAIVSLSLSALSAHAVISSDRKAREFKESLEVNPEVNSSLLVDTAPNQTIWLTGDSVILGIRVALAEIRPLVVVNARVGRGSIELLAEMKRDLEKAIGANVVLDLGNNDLLAESTVREIFELVRENPRVVVVNTAVPRPYRDANNSLIEDIASEFPNIRVVDWNSISAGHPEYFAPDGVHLVPTGASAYVMAIDSALK